MGSNALEHVNAPDLPEALHTMLTPIDDAVGERLTVAVAVPAAAAGEGPGEETTATPMGTTMSGFQSQSDVSGSAFGVEGTTWTNGGAGDSGTSSGRANALNANSAMARTSSQKRKRAAATTTMKGRFSGRLPTKEDEKRLVDECKMVSFYLHPERRSYTVATLIRSIASGVLRAHLEGQARGHEELVEAYRRASEQLSALVEAESRENGGEILPSLLSSVASLQNQLKEVKEENARLRAAAAQLSNHPGNQPEGNIANQIGEAPSQHGLLIERSVSMPMNGVAGVVGVAGVAGVAGVTGVAGVAGVPNGVHQVHQQAPQQMHRSASAAQLSGIGIDGVGVEVQQHMMEATGSLNLSGVAMPGTFSVANQEAVIPAEAVAGAPHFFQAAALHVVAKADASFNAHALTAEARKHSVASLKAAEQADDLKKTLSLMTSSELGSEQALEAQKTVKSLEDRAQMHASMTTQTVAKAKSMMEIAQNHEREQAIAYATACALQQKLSGASAPQTSSPSISAPGLEYPVGATDLPDRMLAHVLPNPTVARPDIMSMANASNVFNTTTATANVAGDNLLNGFPPHVPLDQSISYLHDVDPSTEAMALHQQISALHAQQPESLVSAPPVHIPDADLENITFPAGLPLPDVSKLAVETLDDLLGGDM